MGNLSLENSETLHNLARAFAGECQSNVRLKIISKKALMEGKYDLAKILYEIAKRDFIHSTLFYNQIINNTPTLQNNIEITAGFPFKSGELCQNIKNAYEIKHSEGSVIYPAFATIAKDEGFEEIAALFTKLAQIELEHSNWLQELCEKLKSNKLYKSPQPQKWVCSKCGNIKTGKALAHDCDVCGAEIDFFII